MKQTLILLFFFSSIVAFSQAPRGSRPSPYQRPSADEQAKIDSKRMKKKLGLNETQTSQFYEVSLDFGLETERLFLSIPRDQGPPTKEIREKMRNDMDNIKKEKYEVVKKIFTPEQFEKYIKLQEEEAGPRRRGGGKPR